MMFITKPDRRLLLFKLFLICCAQIKLNGANFDRTFFLVKTGFNLSDIVSDMILLSKNTQDRFCEFHKLQLPFLKDVHSSNCIHVLLILLPNSYAVQRAVQPGKLLLLSDWTPRCSVYRSTFWICHDAYIVLTILKRSCASS